MAIEIFTKFHRAHYPTKRWVSQQQNVACILRFPRHHVRMGKLRQNKDMPPARRTFAERLTAARIMAGHESQKAAAEALGIEAERYRTWERGEREPDITQLVNIAAKFNTSLDFLLLGKTDRDRLRRIG